MDPAVLSELPNRANDAPLIELPAVNLSRIEHDDAISGPLCELIPRPMRAKPLTDKILPTTTFRKVDIDEPANKLLAVLALLPNLTNDDTLSELPSLSKSCREKPFQRFENPNILIPLPSRRYDLIDRLLPQVLDPNELTELPSPQNELKLKELPANTLS